MQPGFRLFQAGAKYGPAIHDGQWWRLLTAGFLHGGILHLLMNSWVLFDLGAATEESYGTSRFLVFYFVSTITGFYASYLWNPGVPSVGSSAGIFGLLGAMIALGMRDKSSYGAAIRSHYLQWGIYAILLSALVPGYRQRRAYRRRHRRIRHRLHSRDAALNGRAENSSGAWAVQPRSRSLRWRSGSCSAG